MTSCKSIRFKNKAKLDIIFSTTKSFKINCSNNLICFKISIGYLRLFYWKAPRMEVNHVNKYVNSNLN